MPGYFLGRLLALPLFVSFLGVFAGTLYYGALLLGDWFDRRTHR
jgi:hypothetical protein